MENNGVSYILPHQEMPSFWDFSTDFHAKYLDCCYETDLCGINVRISEDMYSLTITDKESGEDYYVEIDGKGSLLSDGNLSESAEKQYCDNKDTIKSILEKGNSIYNKVYMD